MTLSSGYLARALLSLLWQSGGEFVGRENVSASVISSLLSTLSSLRETYERVAFTNIVLVHRQSYWPFSTYTGHQVDDICKAPDTIWRAIEPGKLDATDHGVVVACVIARNATDLPAVQ